MILRRTILAAAISVLAIAAQAQDKPGPKNASIVGTWASVDRHVAMGSLFQPVHGVRKREAIVLFEEKKDGLAGHAIMSDHAAISFQERWKEGRTDFRLVQFDGEKLVIEFDIDEWRKEAGPLAVEAGQIDNKGMVRVEARLQGNRLVGKWGLFTKDKNEVFRGEWEAQRAEPKPDKEKR